MKFNKLFLNLAIIAKNNRHLESGRRLSKLIYGAEEKTAYKEIQDSLPELIESIKKELEDVETWKFEKGHHAAMQIFAVLQWRTHSSKISKIIKDIKEEFPDFDIDGMIIRDLSNPNTGILKDSKLSNNKFGTLKIVSIKFDKITPDNQLSFQISVVPLHASLYAPLSGSAKQVDWASSIRDNLAKKVNNIIKDVATVNKLFEKSPQDAGWWIGVRTDKPRELILKILEENPLFPKGILEKIKTLDIKENLEEFVNLIEQNI